MTQGYGPQDPNQQGYGQQPPQPPYGGQPPYGTPAPQAGYGQPAAPAPGGYVQDQPGYYMGRTGQSWGKQVLNLRLVRMADGQPMGGGMAFVRDLVHILDGLLCYIGFLWPLWDARRQTLFGDKIMNTVVLSEG